MGQAGKGGPAPRLATVRYFADGTRQATFGGDSKVSTDIAPRFGSAAWGVAIQPDGSLVRSGVAGAGGPHASFVRCVAVPAVAAVDQCIHLPISCSVF